MELEKIEKANSILNELGKLKAKKRHLEDFINGKTLGVWVKITRVKVFIGLDYNSEDIELDEILSKVIIEQVLKEIDNAIDKYETQLAEL